MYDGRNGRNEAVPTVDVNLWQIGLEEVWLAVVNFYVHPMKMTVYPAQTRAATGGHFFVVRYRADEQPALKPHDDNSVYSINLALNQIGKDFTGGGTRFLR